MKPKISNFPIGFQDEDFRSIIFRFKLRIGKNLERILNDLFNIKSGKLSFFPRNLDLFLSNLPSDFLTSSEIIKNHTSFSFIQPFITNERSNLIKANMEVQSKKIPMHMVHPLIHKDIKYCPSCVKQDINEHGISYIHRIHQFDFLIVCPIHQLKLISNCPECDISLSDNLRGSRTASYCMYLY